MRCFANIRVHSAVLASRLGLEGLCRFARLGGDMAVSTLLDCMRIFMLESAPIRRSGAADSTIKIRRV